MEIESPFLSEELLVMEEYEVTAPSDSQGKRADWSDRAHGGADDAKGRGVDTVDFAMLVTHGGLRPNEQPPYWVAVFDQEPCRFQSNHARFGNGQLK